MAHEQPRLRRQLENAAQRAEQLACIAAGEVGTRGTIVGHEHRVADEHRIADHIGIVCGGVAGDVQDRHGNLADPELVAVLPQLIEIRPVALEVATRVEQLAEIALHGDDMLADRNFSAQLVLQIGGG